MKSIAKKAILAITATVAMISLSGCSISDYIDNFDSEMHYRISMNQQEVDKLQGAGLLSQQSAESLKESIAKQEEKINSLSVGKLNELVCAVEGIDKIKAKNTSRDKALEIISEDNDAIKELLNNLDFEIYVLKKDPLNKGEDSLATLDIISKEIEKAKNGQSSNIDSFFVASGRKVWDTTKDENKIIKKSKDSWAKYNEGKECNVLQKDYVGVKYETDADGNPVLKSKVAIPVQEFDPVVVEKVVGKDGVNKDLYVIVGNKCYLMEYPVQYVRGFKAENGGYSAIYEKSELKINMLTKKIYDSTGRECVAPTEEILKIGGGGSYSELGEASFLVDGHKGEPTTFGFDTTNGNPPNAENFGRVVLRDYLELSYMPGVVEGENLIAVGRRVRLTKFKGTGEEEIGLFVDKKGNEVANSVKIKSTDLMGIDSGTDGKRYKLNLQTVQPTATPAPSTGDVDTSNTFQVGDSQKNLLETEYKDEIDVSTVFPGNVVATTDSKTLGTIVTDASTPQNNSGQSNANQAKHIMYGMSIDIDPFQSNMFSGWIDIVGENRDIGSLDWWNNWLSSSTYKYQIDRDKLLGFLTGTYTYEMRENNLILIDIPTVLNIQEEMDENSKLDAVKTISTIFVILGIIILAYAVLTVVAWVYDVNIVAGPRLLGLISFNRWEAVYSDDEMPYMDKDGKHYMTLGKILKSAVITIITGSILVYVDIISIVGALIQSIGQFAQVLIDTLFGL